MPHKILNLINEGSGYRMIEDDEDKSDAMAKYLEAVSTLEPPTDEDLWSKIKTANCLLTVDFGQNNVREAFCTSDMENSTGLDDLDSRIQRQIKTGKA
ncbi:unnamed protein product [Schistosoma margrebowiei]|uniref:Uncharacterized protein n=1 Tax=Schistosoma margrebowiei TaxID=48269 RepID=A0A183LCP0_9TREM|nr:unnamed protein product [Schistosoma margrebowiei]